MSNNNSSLDKTAKWFTNISGQITGPYTVDQIEAKLQTNSDVKNNANAVLIWGRGMSEWVNPPDWRSYLKQNSSNKEVQKELSWKYRINQEEHGPYKYKELIDALKIIDDLSLIEICSDENNEWYEIFKNKRLIDDLGITRRKHPRVPITGTVDIELENQEIFKTRVVSISEGGIGITDAFNLVVGHEYKLCIKSPNLFSQVNATADVVYIGQDGYCGMKFHHLTAESRSVIIEYVRRFGETSE